MSEGYTAYKSICFKCNENTPSKDFVIKKAKNNRLGLKSKCVICDKGKHMFIKKDIAKKLPKDFRKQLEELKPSTSYGGILPLLALLPLIFGGVAAASGVAGATANAVINKQKANEEARHNAEKEKIMRETAQGSGLDKIEKKTLDKKIKKAIDFLEKHGYKVTMSLSDQSDTEED